MDALSIRFNTRDLLSRAIEVEIFYTADAVISYTHSQVYTDIGYDSTDKGWTLTTPPGAKKYAGATILDQDIVLFDPITRRCLVNVCMDIEKQKFTQAWMEIRGLKTYGIAEFATILPYDPD